LKEQVAKNMTGDGTYVIENVIEEDDAEEME